MIVLGIDPGLSITGFGIAHKHNQKVSLLDYGYMRMSSSKSVAERVHLFYECFTEKIKIHNIEKIALETPFLGKNAQTFLKLGYLRGIVYLIAQQNNLSIHEFSPREVKMTLTGSGAAAKEQVARVLNKLFPKLPIQEKLDVTDALAITLCGIWVPQKVIF